MMAESGFLEKGIIEANEAGFVISAGLKKLPCIKNHPPSIISGTSISGTNICEINICETRTTPECKHCGCPVKMAKPNC